MQNRGFTRLIKASAASTLAALLLTACVTQVDTITYKDPLFGESKMPVHRTKSLSETIYGEQPPSSYRITATPRSKDGDFQVVLHDVPSPEGGSFGWPRLRAIDNQVAAYVDASKKQLCGDLNHRLIVFTAGERRPVYMEAQREVRYSARCVMPKT